MQGCRTKRRSKVIVSEENREIGDFEGVFVVFDRFLDFKQQTGDPFFKQGRHKDLDIHR